MIARAFLALALVAGAPQVAASELDVRGVAFGETGEAWFLADATAPVLAVRFAFEGGMALDPEGKEGTASMVASLLDEGAGELDSQAFKKRLEDRSITISFSAGRDALYGTVYALTDRLDEAAELVNLALTEPRFDSDAVARVRAATLAGIRSSHADPGWAAQRAFNRLLFDGHPYGEPGVGTEASVQAIEVADLQGFVAARLARDTLKVAAVGDVDEERLATFLEIAFAGLPDTSEAFTVPDIEPQGAGEIVLVDRPEAPQSIIVLGHEGMARDDPDYYAAVVMNYILGGGGFASRLQEELREKRGLTYGVSTGLSTLDHAHLITGQVSTPNDQAAEALDLLKAEWRRMRSEGASATEVENAIRYLTGSFPLSLSSTQAIAGLLLGARMDGLGRDYLNIRNDLIRAVTIEDVNRVAARLLDTEDLAVVIAGAPADVVPDRVIEGIPD